MCSILSVYYNLINIDLNLENAKEFFKVCRMETKCILPDDVLNLNQLAEEGNTSGRIVKASDPANCVDMYILPKHISHWPTFCPMKQKKAKDRNMFFHRVSASHRLRFEAVVELLNMGEHVICTGVAGIGKSTEFNAYLMKYLSSIGMKGWPPEVWYRYDTDMFKFKLDAKGDPVVEKVIDVQVKSLLTMTEKYRRSPIALKPILFLELMEDEVNPASHIRTIVQPSNRDINTLTKEMKKAGARYFVINPPTVDELWSIRVRIYLQRPIG